MKQKANLIMSAPTLDMALAGIRKYFYSDDIQLGEVTDYKHGWPLINSNGVIKGFRLRILKSSGRYRFEHLITEGE